MKCPYCSSLIRKETKFCPNCGLEIKQSDIRKDKIDKTIMIFAIISSFISMMAYTQILAYVAIVVGGVCAVYSLIVKRNRLVCVSCGVISIVCSIMWLFFMNGIYEKLF